MTRMSDEWARLKDDDCYTPNRLLNRVMEVLNVDNDAQMAHKLGMDYSMVWKIRHRRAPITAGVMICIMDVAGELTLKEIRKLAGMEKC